MLANMLDEKLMWGESEDVAWSKQTIHNPATNYRMNVNSTVHLLKQKRVIFAKY